MTLERSLNCFIPLITFLLLLITWSLLKCKICAQARRLFKNELSYTRKILF